MSRTIRAVIEIDEYDLQSYIEDIGGSYDENCLSEDINGALDDIPFYVSLVGYNVIGDDGEEEYDE